MIQIIDLNDKNQQQLFEKVCNRNTTIPDNIITRVESIINEVRSKGDEAVLAFSENLDKVKLKDSEMLVSESEIVEAYKNIDLELLNIIRKAKQNIKEFHEKQIEKSWFDNEKPGIMTGQLIRPMERVGIYVPGGTAAYPSSVLMNAVPAKVAGVKEIIMVTPPKADGINPAVLVAAKEAGVDKIYKVGGAQAIAALAFGTETIPKVDKITGPGNIYVAAAKKLVYGFCDIDAIAGPSEVVVIADESANAEHVAADLLSQAEHDPMASAILLTPSNRLANDVAKEIETQTKKLIRKEIIEKSITDFGTIIITKDLSEAIDVSNKLAPEHLELSVESPFELLSFVKNAGAIFLGHYSPEPLGDYFAGPNHVLPTGGTARFFSPLGVYDFVKKTSLIYYSKDALKAVKNEIMGFAMSEGLTAHSNSIAVRFKD
jgi:histidinol dehydrogenase